MVPPHHRQQGQGFHSVPDQIKPGKNWILQYKVHILHLCRKQILFLYQKQLRTVLQAEKMHPNLDASTMLRYLEAYLLWLFGLVLFYNVHNVDKVLIPYTWAITNAHVG
jgi:hypothetical protein